MKYGKLYLIPNFLSENSDANQMPLYNALKVFHIKHFIVESSKPARALLKSLQISTSQQEISLYELNEHTNLNELPNLIKVLEGSDVGLISDAGLPCVADPGWQLVDLAQQKEIEVIPLLGSSSILLALMASGFSGQQFTFNGYLPIDKAKRQQKIREMQSQAVRGFAQIFIEAPYRNNQLLNDLINILPDQLKLCIALNITGENSFVKTTTLSNWRKKMPNLHKQPVIFILG